jgi:hypothetical protein
MTLTNGLIALGIIAVCVDIWYTRKWLRVSKAQLEELQAFARRQLDGEPKP